MRLQSAFLIAISLLLPFCVYAAGGDQKPLNIGIGTYATTIDFEQDFAKDDDLSGGALSIAYAVTDSFALRGTFFSLEHDDFSEIESKGFDLLAHLGVNLASHGFKAYIGGGFFRDTWELGPFEETFDGLQLSGGLGYNWDYVALDFILGIRDPGDYEDFVNKSGVFQSDVSATAVSGNLLLSVRF
jgi:hypothetical protein